MILDATDLRLLHFLQQDGRISNQELAEKVALSPSACLRRLRLLESEGVISGYRAVLNAEQLGIELEAIVHLSLRQDVEDWHETFIKTIPGRPPNNAVKVQMIKAPYRPISGLRWATRAKAMHSGNKAKDVVSPARASARRRESFMGLPGELRGMRRRWYAKPRNRTSRNRLAGDEASCITPQPSGRYRRQAGSYNGQVNRRSAPVFPG